MKFRVRKPNARYRRLHWWHSWYAWYPVRIPTNGRMSGMSLVWLQRVERKGIYWARFRAGGWDWKYR